MLVLFALLAFLNQRCRFRRSTFTEARSQTRKNVLALPGRQVLARKSKAEIMTAPRHQLGKALSYPSSNSSTRPRGAVAHSFLLVEHRHFGDILCTVA